MVSGLLRGQQRSYLLIVLILTCSHLHRDQARFSFTHEILKDEESIFKGQKVPRQRRISIICRNLPA